MNELTNCAFQIAQTGSTYPASGKMFIDLRCTILRQFAIRRAEQFTFSNMLAHHQTPARSRTRLSLPIARSSEFATDPSETPSASAISRYLSPSARKYRHLLSSSGSAWIIAWIRSCDCVCPRTSSGVAAHETISDCTSSIGTDARTIREFAERNCFKARL